MLPIYYCESYRSNGSGTTALRKFAPNPKTNPNPNPKI